MLLLAWKLLSTECMDSERSISTDSDDSLHTYLEEISRFELLDFQEELALARKIEQGDRKALNRLINANLRLVVKIAKGYVRYGMGLMDLIQEGNLGLMKAAGKYDYRKEVRFSTYASWWIKQSVSRALVNKRRAIRLPHRKEEMLRKLQKVSDEFKQEFFRSPSTGELAACTNMSEAAVTSVLDLAGNTVSLDSELSVTNGTLIDLLEDNSYCPASALVDKSMREDTRRFLDILLEKEKTVLEYRFAMDGGKRQTLKSIGKKMGMSPETVRQIEMRALKKLRSEVEPVRQYLYT